jgi:hypothetical protein
MPIIPESKVTQHEALGRARRVLACLRSSGFSPDLHTTSGYPPHFNSGFVMVPDLEYTTALLFLLLVS